VHLFRDFLSPVLDVLMLRELSQRSVSPEVSLNIYSLRLVTFINIFSLLLWLLAVGYIPPLPSVSRVELLEEN